MSLSNEVGTKNILFNDFGTKRAMANCVMLNIIFMEIHSNMARACFGTSIQTRALLESLLCAITTRIFNK